MGLSPVKREMEEAGKIRQNSGMKKMLRTVLVIALCFLLTSTGWLSWEYHLLGQMPADRVDFYTMVTGYLLQAAGIGLFACLIRKKANTERSVLRMALVMHMIFMFPAVLSPYTAATLIFGFLMNLACGVIAGCYLYELTVYAPADRRAASFGIAYAVSILGSWLLSVIDGGRLYYSEKVLLICVITAAAIWLLTVRRDLAEDESEEDSDQERRIRKNGAPDRKLVLTAMLIVILFSTVNGSAFGFPSADLGGAVKVELSRLFYAAGLMIAGFVSDRSRRTGAICALTALMIPFVIMSLRAESISVVIFWALGYFAFGFYAVYRIILFSDMASESRQLWLSGFGLMAGRIGDAAGEAICLLLRGRLTALVAVTAVLFVAAVGVFFRIYQMLYLPEYKKERSEEEHFAAFSAEHDLSSREQDMLRLLLEKKSNSTIADELFISENTVKFHIHNLLQKTGCKNRNELISYYRS